MRLMMSLLLVGIVVSGCAFIPFYRSTGHDVIYGHYTVAFFQLIDSVHFEVRVTYGNNTISLYLLTLEDSYRFINGTPLGDLNPVLALENITRYSNTILIDTPGLYGLVITAYAQQGEQQERGRCSVLVHRSTPHVWTLFAGIMIIGLSGFRYVHKTRTQSLKTAMHGFFWMSRCLLIWS